MKSELETWVFTIHLATLSPQNLLCSQTFNENALSVKRATISAQSTSHTYTYTHAHLTNLNRLVRVAVGFLNWWIWTWFGLTELQHALTRGPGPPPVAKRILRDAAASGPSWKVVPQQQPGTDCAPSCQLGQRVSSDRFMDKDCVWTESECDVACARLFPRFKLYPCLI